MWNRFPLKVMRVTMDACRQREYSRVAGKSHQNYPIGELPTDIFTPNRKGRAMAAGHRTGLVSTHVDRPKQ